MTQSLGPARAALERSPPVFIETEHEVEQTLPAALLSSGLVVTSRVIHPSAIDAFFTEAADDKLHQSLLIKKVRGLFPDLTPIRAWGPPVRLLDHRWGSAGSPDFHLLAPGPFHIMRRLPFDRSDTSGIQGFD